MRSNDSIDRLEKIGRLVLWLALSAMCIAVPMGMFLQAKTTARIAEQAAFELEAERRNKLKAEQEKMKEEADKPPILTLASMGAFMRSLHGDVGQIWFTNASRRSGVVCVKGRASGSKGSTDSLVSCQAVEPFSSVTMKLIFAGAETSKLCQPECHLEVRDARLD